MTDFWALALMLAGIGVALAVMSGDPIAWARREWDLMWADTWEPGRAKVTGGTAEEAACKRLNLRQRALAKRMKKKGRHLYAGKRYKPALTAPTAAPATPPRADKIVRHNFRRKVG